MDRVVFNVIYKIFITLFDIYIASEKHVVKETNLKWRGNKDESILKLQSSICYVIQV